MVELEREKEVAASIFGDGRRLSGSEGGRVHRRESVCSNEVASVVAVRGFMWQWWSRCLDLSLAEVSPFGTQACQRR